MNEFKALNFFDSNGSENKEYAISAEAKDKDVVAAENCEIAIENEESIKQGEDAFSDVITEEAEENKDDIHIEKILEQPDKLDKVLKSQQLLLERLKSLDILFNTRIMHTEYEEKIVDQMHKELQKYKEDMYAQLVRPILLDVIEVRDSIMRMAAVYLAKSESEQSIPNKTFSAYAYDLQDILEKNSVEIYRSKAGDDFTPIKQRVIKKTLTTDEDLHGKVAESLSCGYSYNGRIISAEKITIYYYEKPVEINENSEVIENG